MNFIDIFIEIPAQKFHLKFEKVNKLNHKLSLVRAMVQVYPLWYRYTLIQVKSNDLDESIRPHRLVS